MQIKMATPMLTTYLSRKIIISIQDISSIEREATLYTTDIDEFNSRIVFLTSFCQEGLF